VNHAVSDLQKAIFLELRKYMLEGHNEPKLKIYFSERGYMDFVTSENSFQLYDINNDLICNYPYKIMSNQRVPFLLQVIG
jgi:hypothetical protein